MTRALKPVGRRPPPGLEIRDCKHGRGVFATKPFSAGDVITVVRGGRMVRAAAEASMASLRVGKKLWWDENAFEKKVDWDYFLDHSSKPNARLAMTRTGKAPEADLLALLPIGRGDEVLIDYHEYGDRVYAHARYS